MALDLPSQLAALRVIVLRAGGELLDRLGDAGVVEAKGGAEFVTAMDRRSEEILLAGLDARFAADAVRTEESDGHGGTSGRTWHIDPLDGTTNYAHGHPFFAVSAACADADGLLLGAVYAPYLDEFYLATRGGGATLERPLHGTATVLAAQPAKPLAEALLATGFPYVRDDLVDRNTNLVRDFLKAPCHGVRRAGSAAIDLCHVAAGKLDGYWEFRLRSWDTAAGTLVAREAGVRVTGIDGVEEAIHWEHILAARPDLHRDMAAVLAAAGEPA